MSNRLIRAIAITALLSGGNAQAFVIDGNLSDWGLHHVAAASAWTPNSSVAAYKVEDQTGNGNTLLNPGYGGQAYDAEALYVSWDAHNMYIAIATGHSPLTPNIPTAAGDSYAPGDIAIDFGANGSFDYGIELLGSGTTTQGHVYSNVNWGLGLWKAGGNGMAYWTGYYDPSAAGNIALADKAHPTSILSGTDVGTGVVAYTTVGQSGYGVYSTDLHYFYEVSVPLSAFGANWVTGNKFELHWTENCANDSILFDSPVTVKTVPEPGTLALLPLGMIGLMVLRRNTAAA